MAGVGVAVAGSLWLVLGELHAARGPARTRPRCRRCRASRGRRRRSPRSASGWRSARRLEPLAVDPASVATPRAGAYSPGSRPESNWRLASRGIGTGGHQPGRRQLGIHALSSASSRSDSGAPVLFNGHPYRGDVTVLRDRTGMTVVDRLPLETYLQGVVSAEMGRRSPAEQEALRAQAWSRARTRSATCGDGTPRGSISTRASPTRRTAAPRRRRPRGTTRSPPPAAGYSLTDGAPIDAFFYSTCGGRTAEGTEVFRAADRPYLRSVADVADDGTRVLQHLAALPMARGVDGGGASGHPPAHPAGARCGDGSSARGRRERGARRPGSPTARGPAGWASWRSASRRQTCSCKGPTCARSSGRSRASC